MVGLDESNNVMEAFLLFCGGWGLKEEEIENELGGRVGGWTLTA